MKAKKISETLRLSRFLLIVSVAIVALSCDVLEPDPDVLEPTTNVNGKEIYVLANSPAIVDLNAKLQTNTPVRIALTSQARHGKISDLGKGLLQYSPSVGNSRARDGFDFTVYTLNNEIIKRDSVIIFIENDSTNLPCNIYPSADYVYGVDHDPVIVDVTSNDVICGGDVTISIYKPENSFPPNFGEADVVGNMIKYDPGPEFQGYDRVVYKVSTAKDTSRWAYGIVYLMGDSACSTRLASDRFVFGKDAVDSLIWLPVYNNDTLCYSFNSYQVNLSAAPLYGKASLTPSGINYKVPATLAFPFSDYFTYQLCINATCVTARVDIKLEKDSVSFCPVKAMTDSFDISNYNTSLHYLDVLLNDSTCQTLNDFRITKEPLYGTATVANQKITYQGSITAQKNDSLRYEICNSRGCSSAVVYIKRKK
jgi:hypothetical protein